MRFGILCEGPKRWNKVKKEWESSDGIVFEGWSPGGEYVQKLRVKNVSLAMKKLKYKLPRTRYFSLAFPETINLSPGMCVEIDVIFRPLKSEAYNDTVYFKLEEGPPGMHACETVPRGFHVPVMALLATLRAEAPSGVDMGLCPTNEVSRAIFEIVNVGEVRAPFEWTVPPPFRLSPLRGEINVGESVKIEASIEPTEARVFVSRALCKVGLGVNHATVPCPVIQTKLSAIGKYAYVTLSDERVDFGSVLTGTSAEHDDNCWREVTVCNTSLVPATVTVRRVETDAPSFFCVTPEHFVIPPRAEQQLRVTFSPTSAGCYLADRFELKTPGGNTPRLLITGFASVPNVCIYKAEDPFAGGLGVPNSVNFGSIKVGCHATRALFLRNDSELPVAYQFLAGDPNGTFQLNDGRDRGVIPARLHISLKLIFEPQRPINYYRRLFVLVERRPPLFIDLIGTAFISADGHVKEQRPAPLRHAHVQAYRNRVAAGLGGHSPDDLESHLQNHHSDVENGDENRLLFARIGANGHDQVFAKTKVNNPVTRSGDGARADLAPAHELFTAVEEVSISKTYLDFDDDQNSSPRSFKTVTVKNKTRGKITVAWRQQLNSGSNQPDFVVSPDIVDVSRGSSFDFKVSFDSKKRPYGTYSYAALEATCYFKSQRTFRLVTDATLTPPWRLEITASGRSAGSGGSSQFAPQLSFEPASVAHFPPCFVSDATFQTIKLVNKSNLPAYYNILSVPDDSDEHNDVFAIKPKTGQLPPNGFQLLIAQFRPSRVGAFSRRLIVRVNGEETRGTMLQGSGHLPDAVLCSVDDESCIESLCFEPTCVGLSTRRVLRLRNTSRVPFVFVVKLLPAKLEASSVFAVKPRSGLLRGNESRAVTISFAPREAQKIVEAKCVVKIRPIAGEPDRRLFRDARQLGEPLGPAAAVRHLSAKLVAPAGSGVVSFEPSALSFPTLLVNTEHTQELVLINAAPCALAYSLFYLHQQQQHPLPQDSAKAHRLVVNEPTGTLPARSRKRICVTFRPDRAGDFDFACVCKVRAIDPSTGAAIDLEPSEAAMLALGDRTREAKLVRGDVQEQPPLSCIVTGHASFPTVVVRDARVEYGAGRLACMPSHIWTRLNLRDLNKTLLEPLDSDEVKLNCKSSPDLSSLRRFSLKFAPEPFGSPPQVLLLDLHNPGSLPTSFCVHLPNERDIEIEQWADEAEPTEADVKVNRVIDELKCFDISPRGLRTIAPGESVTLRISYSFCSRELDGRHELPVLLRVAQGKQVWLDLIGLTLAPHNEAHLVIADHPTRGELSLQPVAVGTRPELAPLQRFEVFNAGSAATDYEVRLDTPLEYFDGKSNIFRQEEQEYRLLTIENPFGNLGPRSSAHLNLRFLPLRIATYRAKLSIRYRSSDDVDESIAFFIIIEGYDPVSPPQPPQLFSQPPDQQLALSKDQLVVLSNDVVRLGRVPQRAHLTRVVIIRPLLQATNGQTIFLDFQWEAAHDLIESGLLEIRPLSGTIVVSDKALQESSIATCRVILKANTDPRLIDDSVLLNVKQRLASVRAGSSGSGSCVAHGSIPSSTRRSSTSTIRQRELKLASVSSREELASCCTVSREKKLTQTTLPNSRYPMMPSASSSLLKQNTDESSCSNKIKAAASTFSEFCDSATLDLSSSRHLVRTLADVHTGNLRLRIVADIVADDEHIALHRGHRDDFFIPRPLIFIPPSSHARDDRLVPASPKQDHAVVIEQEPTKPIVLRGVLHTLFNNILQLSDTRTVFDTLPETPGIVKYYTEIKRKGNLYCRLGLDSEARTTLATLGTVFSRLGIKTASAQLKAWLASLSTEDIVPDVRQWLKDLHPNVKLAVDIALDDAEYAKKITLRDRRTADRLRRLATQARDKAATTLQRVHRVRTAKRRVQTRRYLVSDLGVAHTRGAVALQNCVRTRRSRLAAKNATRRRLESTALAILGEPGFQAMVYRALEATVYNIVQESLHNEFDFDAKPVHRIFATSEVPTATAAPTGHTICTEDTLVPQPPQI